MTFTITTNFLFAGNLFTFLFGLTFSALWFLYLLDDIRYQGNGSKDWFKHLLLLCAGILVIVTSVGNIAN